MIKTEYKPIQIPKRAYDMLKKYCDLNSLKIGKFVANLIIESIGIIDIPRKNIRVVKTTNKYMAQKSPHRGSPTS